jgi:hypothetical protein
MNLDLAIARGTPGALEAWEDRRKDFTAELAGALLERLPDEDDPEMDTAALLRRHPELRAAVEAELSQKYAAK